jgi:hypothetical protein
LEVGGESVVLLYWVTTRLRPHKDTLAGKREVKAEYSANSSWGVRFDQWSEAAREDMANFFRDLIVALMELASFRCFPVLNGYNGSQPFVTVAGRTVLPAVVTFNIWV